MWEAQEEQERHFRLGKCDIQETSKLTIGDTSVRSRETGMEMFLWKTSSYSTASMFKAQDTHAFLSSKDTQK